MTDTPVYTPSQARRSTLVVALVTGAIAAWHNGVPDYYHAGSGLNVTQWPHGMRKYHQVVSMEDDDAYEIGQFEPRTEVL